jgi:hypothetical protein
MIDTQTIFTLTRNHSKKHKQDSVMNILFIPIPRSDSNMKRINVIQNALFYNVGYNVIPDNSSAIVVHPCKTLNFPALFLPIAC